MIRKFACLILLGVLPLTFGVVPETGKANLQRLVRIPFSVPELDLACDVQTGFALFAGNGRSTRSELSSLAEKLREHPQEISAFLKFGRWQRAAGLEDKAKLSFESAEVIAQRKLQTAPLDWALWKQLGQARWSLGKWDPAEYAFRQATRVSSISNAAPWMALGQFLQAKAGRSIWPAAKISFAHFSPARFEAALHGHSGSWSDWNESEKSLQEADVCFAQTAKLGASDAEIRFQLALARSYQRFLIELLREHRAKHPDAAVALEAFFSNEALIELEQAERLKPENVRIAATRAFWSALVYSEKRGLPGSLNWNRLPEACRSSILGTLSRLEQIGENGEAAAAAEAIECKGLLQAVVLQDLGGAAGTLQRAAQLDSSRDRPFDEAVLLLNKMGEYDRLLDFVEARVKPKPAAYPLVLLAEAQGQLNWLDKAQGTALVAVALEPENFAGHLALASLFLKEADQPASLLQAGVHLQKAQEIKPKNRDDLIELALAMCLYHAFRDNMAEAKKLLKTVLEADRDNEYAQRISAVLR